MYFIKICGLAINVCFVYFISIATIPDNVDTQFETRFDYFEILKKWYALDDE